MTSLWLIRHPPVALPAGICYGVSDVPAMALTSDRIAAMRASLPLATRIVSSPLSRCLALAHALARGGEPPIPDTRLREMDFGNWELLPFAHIERDRIDAWAAAPWDFLPPGGERAEDMSRRVLSALRDHLAAAADALALVAHGGPLRVIMGHLLRLPREQWLALPCDPGSLTHLQLDDSGARLLPTA